MSRFRFLLFFILTLFVSRFATAEISLKDLGFNEKNVELSSQEINDQKLLEKRHKMLKTHEILGLSTLAVMTATIATGGMALSNDTHMYLGMTSGLLYFTTAYFSLSAPRPEGISDRGNIKWHKRLAWIHFPAMLLAPVFGYIYKKNEEAGRTTPSIIKAHPAIAGVGYGAFALSAALMTIEF